MRLRAFEELLAEERISADDTVFLQIATPSRERVEHYIRLRAEIEQTVGRINGDHSRIGLPPVHYLHQSLPREELTAFYLAADVMLVTPLRDGMNLVAKEYVACRHDDGGVLVLSEFTGAARELTSALLVNPHDIDGVKAAVARALEMPPDEARRRMKTLRRHVQAPRRGPVGARVPRRAGHADVTPSLDTALESALRELARVPTLLVALDFDGVLAPIVQDPSTSRPLPGSAAAVGALADLPATTVAMLSGRALDDLRAVSGFAAPVRLVGSHGGEFDDGALELTDAQRDLKDQLSAAVRQVVDGEPGVRLESKPAGIVVHVRGAEPDGRASGCSTPCAPAGAAARRRVDGGQGRAGDGGGAGQQGCGDRHAARAAGRGRGAVRRRRRHGRDGVRPAAAGGRRGEGGRRRHGGGVPGGGTPDDVTELLETLLAARRG